MIGLRARTGRDRGVPATHAPPVPRETSFGAVVPLDAYRQPGRDKARSGTTRIRRWLRRCAGVVPAAWLTRCWRETGDETVVARLGSVAIHGVPPCQAILTRVNGEQKRARETAVRRLAGYLYGDNQALVWLQAAAAVEQQQVAPDQWRVSVRLTPGPDPAPMPCMRKVKLIARDAELLAVVRMTGLPDHIAVSRGDAVILDAIASSDWVAAGPPMLRLRPPGPGWWISGGFSVVVPVARRVRIDPGPVG